MSALAVEDAADGGQIGVVVQFASCHPQVVGPQLRVGVHDEEAVVR